MDGFLVSTGIRSDEMLQGIVSVPIICDEVMEVGYVTHSERRVQLAQDYLGHLYQRILDFDGGDPAVAGRPRLQR